jgi:hypothetical protein
MDLQIINHGGIPIAEVQAAPGEIADTRTALDLLADAHSLGAQHVLTHELHFDHTFFDLRSGLAGEILQKFINYQMRLAVVGNFDKYESKSLQAFIIECNRGRNFTFCADRTDALNRLARQA